MGFTLRPKNVPKVSGETHTHVTTVLHRGWGDLEPSPAPGRTPPSTAARRAGRRRRRPGPCTAVPGGRSDPEHLGDTFLSPPVFCGGGDTQPGSMLTLPGRARQLAPRRSGRFLGQAGCRAVKLMLKWVPQSNICRGGGERTEPSVASRHRQRKGSSPSWVPELGTPSCTHRIAHPSPTVLVTPSSLSSLSSCPWVSSTERARSRGAGSPGGTAALAASNTAPSTSAMRPREKREDDGICCRLGAPRFGRVCFQDKHRAPAAVGKGSGCRCFPWHGAVAGACLDLVGMRRCRSLGGADPPSVAPSLRPLPISRTRW